MSTLPLRERRAATFDWETTRCHAISRPGRARRQRSRPETREPALHFAVNSQLVRPVPVAAPSFAQILPSARQPGQTLRRRIAEPDAAPSGRDASATGPVLARRASRRSDRGSPLRFGFRLSGGASGLELPSRPWMDNALRREQWCPTDDAWEGSMKTRHSLIATAIVALSLACSGSQGPAGPPGPAGPAGDAGPRGNNAVTLITVPSNSATPTAATSAAWAALVPKVTVTGVTIASPPVVKFKVTDAAGVPIAGLGNTSKSSTASVAGLDQPRLRPGQAGAGRQRSSQQVGQLHRDDGADADRGRRDGRPHRPGPAPTTPAPWWTTATGPTPTPSTATSPRSRPGGRR